MKIKDFLQGREVERQAVTRYINRHNEVFETHVKKVGKELELDDVAIAELEKIYPLPSPVNIVNGIPQEEYIKLQNELITTQKLVGQLQDKLLDSQEQLTIAKINEALLMDKSNELAKTKDEVEVLREQLLAEKSKGFFQKLFGR